jgi:hypothetical protein
MAEYPPESHGELRKALAIGDAWTLDRLIVLTSSSDTIERNIRRRKRPHENTEQMVRRFRLIDAEFRRLASSYSNSVVIDRDGIEFHAREGLMSVIAAAGLPPFRDIPYRQMDRYSPR